MRIYYTHRVVERYKYYINTGEEEKNILKYKK